MEATEKHDKLLLLGIVAQANAVGLECTPYLAAKLGNISHVTARKRLLHLERIRLLRVKTRATANGLKKAVFSLTEEGTQYLRDNKDLFVQLFLVHLLF